MAVAVVVDGDLSISCPRRPTWAGGDTRNFRIQFVYSHTNRCVFWYNGGITEVSMSELRPGHDTNLAQSVSETKRQLRQNDIVLDLDFKNAMNMKLFLDTVHPEAVTAEDIEEFGVTLADWMANVADRFDATPEELNALINQQMEAGV